MGTVAAYPLILPYPNNAFYDPPTLAGFRLPLNAYEVNEDSTMVNMVVQGWGSYSPRLAAEPLPPEVHVCSLPVPLEIIGVAVLANTLQTPAVFAFLDTLRSAGRFTLKNG